MKYAICTMLTRIWISLIIIVAYLSPNRCIENWPRNAVREPRIQRVLEGKDVVLRCAGRIESTRAHWEYKPCGGVHNANCSNTVNDVRSDGVGQGWMPVKDAGMGTLKVLSASPNDTGLYRCRQQASQLIDLNSATMLEVLPHQDEEDTDLPVFLEGLPKNITVNKDMQAVFHCKVSSRTPPRILWVTMGTGAGSGALQYLKKWYDPLQPDGEVGLGGNVHFSKMKLPRARAQDAGRYFCIALNTKGFTNKSAYLEVLGDDENKDWLNGEHASRSHYFLFLLPLVLAVPPGMLWLWYLCRVRRRRNKEKIVQANLPLKDNQIYVEFASGSNKCTRGWSFN